MADDLPFASASTVPASGRLTQQPGLNLMRERAEGFDVDSNVCVRDGNGNSNASPVVQVKHGSTCIASWLSAAQ